MDLTAAGAAREVRPTCPVHDIRDCSSLLNGCSLPIQMVAYGQQLLDHVRAKRSPIRPAPRQARDGQAGACP
ncbi:hypothetical protein CHO01_37070 [Cellulomonas hominis]|uniref:Uncharacterized protein n=1 Tax=Cellulomonas hominis TaxID=156981 RepID=A0A511FHA8_9CELL|nr:hypothetical protein [Cellulomonas hominis]GEL48591.1 hypothetical protein CHO01_37070 [Cellulomonas hominis]